MTTLDSADDRTLESPGGAKVTRGRSPASACHNFHDNVVPAVQTEGRGSTKHWGGGSRKGRAVVLDLGPWTLLWKPPQPLLMLT